MKELGPSLIVILQYICGLVFRGEKVIMKLCGRENSMQYRLLASLHG